MLTKAEKSVLQKSTTKRGLEASRNYEYQIKFKARKKAEKALDDLEFLAREYPKAVNLELLLNVVDSYLNQESFKITMKERTLQKKGLPRSVKKKLQEAGLADLARAFDDRVMVQVAGVLRDHRQGYESAPLKKNLGQKMFFCYELLGTVMQSLGDLSPIGSMKDGEHLLLLSRKNGKFSLSKLP